ncbi:SPOR domain-containing protein [Antarcticirhabdus aurantiaca]|uniref:SPOR domain-containing protein n=1 Tax=Antarcticirhabdus aurantiaca TaxID=2606717 RepID=A0ACD4NWH6_9HYPH|nr:SPOR domain-containing protein [Antarcticirhabdus aurantiaca]WAJ31131.1 SPOR domain-containing protein [Jeongeuplla avenae]
MGSMGNARRGGGAIGTGPAGEDVDPFDDLARLLDEPWSDSFPIGAKTPASAKPKTPVVDDAFEAAFAAEFSKIVPGRRPAADATSPAAAGGIEAFDDFVSSVTPEKRATPAPSVQTSYAGWVGTKLPEAPKLAKPAAPAPVQAAKPSGKKGPASALDAAIEQEIEDAIRGLSAPANPRGNGPNRAESYAPERRPFHDEPVARHTAAIDDFDALIASELAILNQERGFNRGSGEGLPAGQSDDAMPVSPGAAPIFVATADMAAPARRPRRNYGRAIAKGLTIGTGLAAMVAGGVFLSGYLSVGGSSVAGGGPVLLKADAEPVKIAPENPGGKSIPNQNKAVYTRVQSGGAAEPPAQQELRVEAEEPMELAPESEGPSISEELPGVSFYDDGPGEAVAAVADAPGEAAEADPVLQPRRVRALTVRPDGTLVAEADPSAPSLETLQGGSALVETAARPVEIASADPSEPVPASSPVADMITASTAPRAELAADEVAALAAQPPAAMPAEAPTEPAAAAAPAIDPSNYAGYYVQISSQPSAEAAQKSSDSLRGKFASVLNGRDVVIQSADIPGKGTYHRVRVLAGSQNEASSLCEALKSAGGSCFVSR